VLLLLSKVFNLAERWGWRPEGAGNPARLVERFREAPRHRYLSLEEFKRLGEALAAAESDSPIAVAAIRLLIYTGARREEILTAKWEYVDRASAALRLPTSKTGFKVIQLNAPALAVLASLPRLAKNPYILPGVRTGQHAVNITKVWYAVREAAGIKDVRLHDLRHSHASVGAAAGLSLPIIGGLLGHAAPATTARYAHLSADPLKRASETVGERLAAAMGTR
jgi:integrase